MNAHQWLLDRFGARQHDRKFVGYLEAWVSIAGNLALFAFKLAAGMSLSSIALVADAWHSLSDVLTSLVVLVGFKLGSRPADEQHPHGHGRIEYVASLVIAFLLFAVAWELGKRSILRIVDPRPVSSSVPIVALLVVCAAFKEWMARFSVFLGRKIGSSALVADAWHHRSDAIATVLVAVGLVVGPLGAPWLDGVLGTGVSLLLLWVAIGLARTAANEIIGKAPDAALVTRIRDRAMATRGVTSCHGVKLHDYLARTEVSLHVVVRGDLSALDAHRLAAEVERAIEKDLGEGHSVTAHVDIEGEPDD